MTNDKDNDDTFCQNSPHIELSKNSHLTKMMRSIALYNHVNNKKVVRAFV